MRSNGTINGGAKCLSPFALVLIVAGIVDAEGGGGLGGFGDDDLVPKKVKWPKMLIPLPLDLALLSTSFFVGEGDIEISGELGGDGMEICGQDGRSSGEGADERGISVISSDIIEVR